MSKGSKRRPTFVSEEQAEENWRRTFGGELPEWKRDLAKAQQEAEEERRPRHGVADDAMSGWPCC